MHNQIDMDGLDRKQLAEYLRVSEEKKILDTIKEELRGDIANLDSFAGILRDKIYEFDDDNDYIEILEAIDNLQFEITELQIKKNWI
jgi:hypothetical protein